MRFSIKIILGIWLVLLLILAGVVFSAYSKLKPEALISLMQQQVERNYPGTELKVGSMDYRFALDFKLQLKDISLIRSAQKIGSIGSIEVKLPWWLFLSNKGSAQINLSHMEILLDKVAKEPGGSSGSGGKDKGTVKARVPSYLLSAKYTLRAKDITIRDLRDSHRYIVLSKLLVREFQFGKNSAFELTLPIEVTHNAAKYNSELWLFGDLTPRRDLWTLNYRGEFKTRDLADKFQLEDVIINGTAEIHSHELELESNLNFLLEKDVIGRGTVVADKDQLSIAFDFDKFPLNYLGIINDEINNPFLPLLDGYGSGKLRLEKNNKNGSLILSSRLSFDGPFNLAPDLAFQGKWQLSFNDTKWETSFMSPNGEVSFFRRSIIDFDADSLVQYNEEVGFSGIDFTKAMRQLKKLSDLRAENQNVYYVSTTSFKQCLQGEEKVNGQMKYGHSPDLKFYQLDLVQNASTLKLSYQEKAKQEQFSLDATKFPFNGHQFLAPYFTAAAANLSGRIQGKWMDQWQNGEWIFNLKQMEVKEGTGSFPEMLTKLSAPFGLETQQPAIFNAELRNGKIDVKNMSMDGPDGAKLTGMIFTKGNSYLLLHYPKNKRLKPVRKDLGQFQF